MERIERVTYRLHWRAAIFESIFNSAMWASADVAAKNLGAQALEVTLLTMAPGGALLLSLFMGNLLDAASRRQLFLVPGFVGRLPLVIFLLNGDMWLFIALITLQAVTLVPITGALNSLLRKNYRDHVRGSLFSRAGAIGHLASGIFMFLFGLALDKRPEIYQYVYGALAIVGLVSCFILARIPERAREPASQPPRFDPLYAVKLLTQDRLFLRYELGFFLYGLAFMMAVTAKPLFAAHTLQLENASMLGARGIFSACMVLFAPFMGRLMDRLNPAGLMGWIGFPLLIVQSYLLWIAQDVTGYLIAETVFGVSMASVLIAWNIGPVNFASVGNAARYMSVHVALVGVRAIIGHPLGGIISEKLEPRTVFPLSMALFAVATVIMIRLRKPMVDRQAQLRGPEDLADTFR